MDEAMRATVRKMVCVWADEQTRAEVLPVCMLGIGPKGEMSIIRVPHQEYPREEVVKLLRTMADHLEARNDTPKTIN